ncbi:hypothetical protein [Propionibacterium sp.]|uniref:hypothetical protein n=1 Tax=Propionibacterium sp. TaxID=1977903 RepID=UPI0039E8A2B4
MRSALIRQAIAAVTGTLISILLILTFQTGGDPGRRTGMLAFVVLVLPALYGWCRLIAELIKRHQIRRAIARIVPGLVLRVERPGLVLRNGNRLEFIRWEHISAVRGVRRWDLPGPELRVVRRDGTHWAVPFILLNVLPGGIDDGLRAYSGERLGLDMTACDDLW